MEVKEIQEKTYWIPTDDGAELYCKVIGEGRPLLFIHGMMVDANFFNECSHDLGQNHMVITYDRRGYSRSVGNGEDYSVQRQVKDALCVLRALVETPTDIVGCSAGAVIAYALADQKSEIVRNVILHEIPLYGLTIPTEQEKACMENTRKFLSMGRYERAMLEFLSSVEDDRPPDLTEESLQRQWKNGLLFIEKEFDQIIPFIPEKDSLSSLSHRQNIYSAFGVDSGNSFCARAAKELAKQKGIPCIPFPGKHNCARDLPHRFAKKVEEILI